MTSTDSDYKYEEEKLAHIRTSKPWMIQAKYFKRVKISPSATIKMMMHGQSGVESGVKKSGIPIEVMGLLVGRPDVVDLNCLIVTDALPLPAEGFETRVVLEDDSVLQYMIDITDSLDQTRKETLCGWYHTHPFELDGTSKCYMSNTDITSQIQWQRHEDPQGNPWVAIVIDPLRSIALGRPELMAFRAYPVDHTPEAHETPDGTINPDDRACVAQWGACWNRYYRLEVQYFISSLAQKTLDLLRQKFSWQKVFSTTPKLEEENPAMTLDTIQAICNKLDTSESSQGGGVGMMRRHVDSSPLGGAQLSDLQQTAQSGLHISIEQCESTIGQAVKQSLFVTLPKGDISAVEAASSTAMDVTPVPGADI